MKETRRPCGPAGQPGEARGLTAPRLARRRGEEALGSAVAEVGQLLQLLLHSEPVESAITSTEKQASQKEQGSSTSTFCFTWFSNCLRI